MDWNTLLSVALGGLIATLASIINNRYQSRERDKDRQEQRKEAKIQAKEKWTERDIILIIEMEEKLWKWLSSYDAEVEYLFDFRKNPTTDKEALNRLKALSDKKTIKLQEYTEIWGLMGGLVYSFEEPSLTSAFYEFSSAWHMLLNKLKRGLNQLNKEEGKLAEVDRTDEWKAVQRASGKLQKALREKLISIRDN